MRSSDRRHRNLFQISARSIIPITRAASYYGLIAGAYRIISVCVPSRNNDDDGDKRLLLILRKTPGGETLAFLLSLYHACRLLCATSADTAPRPIAVSSSSRYIAIRYLGIANHCPDCSRRMIILRFCSSQRAIEKYASATQNINCLANAAMQVS